MNSDRMVLVYFLGGPWDLTKKRMYEKDLFSVGHVILVRHPGKRVHTEYTSKGEAVAVFAQVQDHQYEWRQVGPETFIALHKDVIQ